QTRSFCYVDDLINGIYRLLLSDRVEPTNIGNPHEMTIHQFAERILALTGSTSEIIYKDLPVDDPKTRQPDITMARRHLDWQPEVPLDEGLRATVDYFRGVLEAEGRLSGGPS
ncbi:MAG: SDR family NAD-dependent epimerase/dehydratase, partial [Acidobacteriota bacterium]